MAPTEVRPDQRDQDVSLRMAVGLVVLCLAHGSDLEPQITPDDAEVIRGLAKILHSLIDAPVNAGKGAEEFLRTLEYSTESPTLQEALEDMEAYRYQHWSNAVAEWVSQQGLTPRLRELQRVPYDYQGRTYWCTIVAVDPILGAYWVQSTELERAIRQADPQIEDAEIRTMIYWEEGDRMYEESNSLN